jgi:hypothetical protein
VDPDARFKGILTELTKVNLRRAPRVNRSAIEQAAAAAATRNDAANTVAPLVARQSALTEEHARMIFASSYDRHLSASEDHAMAATSAADDVVDAAEQAATASVGATLSDPVMMPEWFRGVLAGATAIAAGGALVLIFHLGRQKSPPSAWVFVAMSVALFFFVVATLILTMGYKNVQMNGAFGSPGENSSGSQ